MLVRPTRSHLWNVLCVVLLSTVAVVGTACTPGVSIPTVAVLPSLTPKPTIRPSPRPTVPVTPSAPPKTATPLVTGDLTIDDTPVIFQSRRIMFTLRMTPRSSKAVSATLSYTYPKTKKSSDAKASLTPQKPGEQMPPIVYSIGVDAVPLNEDQVRFTWKVTTEDGTSFTSPEAIFKLTEATTAERREDLPIIDATTDFKSDFPKKATFTLKIKPDSPIAYAKFQVTQNHGIYLQTFPVNVPRKKTGEELVLNFVWYDQFGLQIPWQAFETWWVLTDERGHTWRTKPAVNDYADTRFHQWTRTETKHAVLYTYKQSSQNIAKLVKATDDSYERLSRIFGYELVYAPHVVVYNTQADFMDWSPPAIVERFIGMASGDWGGCVVTVYDTMDFTGYAIIQHEFVHLFQFQSLRQTAPQWWIEGNARYFEQKNPEYDEIVPYVKSIVEQYGPTNLTIRVPSRPPDDSGIPWPYYVGMTFTKFFIENYGEETFQRVVIAAARDIAFLDALKIATGKTVTQLNQEWADWITKQ